MLRQLDDLVLQHIKVNSLPLRHISRIFQQFSYRITLLTPFSTSRHYSKMHPSATIVLLASLASAGGVPPRDTASSTFKLESRLPNGTSMGYFTPTVGGGAWFGALVDDISDAKSLLLTDSSSEKASLIVPEDDSDDLNIYWNIGWLIGQYDSGQIEWVSLQREQDVEAWSTGFSIDGDEDNLLKYDVPMIFGGEFEG